MAEAVKERKAKGAPEASENMNAQTVEELEKEALGPKKPKANKESKEKRKPGMAEAIVLTSLLWLSIFSAFILLVMFDPTPDKVIRGATLLLINPDEETRSEYWASDIYYMQDWEKELYEWAQELELLSGDLDLREEMLDEREDDLEDREMEVEDWLDAMRAYTGGAAGESAVDLTQTAKMIERMTPSVAAAALAEMDFDSAVRVCKLISPKKLAPITSVMEQDFLVALLDALTAMPEADEFDFGDFVD